jgi:dTDP-4-dehydrorhamnose reductase
MILVTGASGMVGSHLLDVFSEADLYRTDLHAADQIHALDCRNRDQVMEVIGRVRPHVVLHMGAETDVDRCERDIDHAFRSNALATLNIALACQRFDVTLVYVSTAGVFDGKKPEPYTEFDLPNPVNVYATSKLEGEKFVQSFVPKHYIVRAGWMFGGKGKDKKFVGKIASMCLENGAEIKAVDDKFGCPTYAVDLLAAVKTLIQSDFYGIYHLVNSGSCSRYDVAVEISRFLGKTGRVVPVCSANFPLSAPRPRSEASRPYKFELLGLGRMRTWREALVDYLTAWQAAAAIPASAVAGTASALPPGNGAELWKGDAVAAGGLDKGVFWSPGERRDELEAVKVTPIAPAAAAVV